MAHSTKGSDSRKPNKPSKSFPLSPRADGRWGKKYKTLDGQWQYAYFTGTAAEALAEWERVKGDLIAGRPARPKGDGLGIAELVNRFLHHKRGRLESGEITARTWERYEATGKLLAAHFGRERHVDTLYPEDFDGLRAAMAKRYGAVALANEIGIVRSMFIFGFKNGLLATPARFGTGFDKPSAKTLRRQRSSEGPKLFTADQIHSLLKLARPAMRAMILLGINGGLGNTDVAELTAKPLDLDGGWLDYARGKTGIRRRIPLWPETVQAIRAAIAARVEPKDGSDRLFVGARGETYVGNGKSGYRIMGELKPLLAKAGIQGRAFYDLRRTFATVATGAKDETAVESIMGHAPPESDMGARYRQSLPDDARLRAVADHVHAWLYPEEPKGKGKPAAKGGAKGHSAPSGQRTKSSKPRASAELVDSAFAFSYVA